MTGLALFLIALSSAVLFGFLRLHARRGRETAVWCFLAIVSFAFLMMPPLMIQCAVLCLVALALPKSTPQRIRIGLGVCGTAVPYVFVITSVVEELNRLQTLRDRYPFVAVNERLAYEGTYPPIAVVNEDTAATAAAPKARGTPATPLILASHVEDALLISEQTDEGQRGYRSRTHALERLHDEQADRFAVAQGFGVGRMLPIALGLEELPPNKPIPVVSESEQPAEDAPSYVVTDGSTLRRAEESGGAPDAGRAIGGRRAHPPGNVLVDLHVNGRISFLDRQRFGYVNDQRQAAGFDSHAFSQRPESPATSDGPWQVTRLELVSLLRFDEPRVYISSELPNMDQLRDVPTRALDIFEQDSLRELGTEQDVVIDHEPGRIRMLGSLRAGEHCRQCHSVNRGELLGAFSYVLRPAIHATSAPAAD